MERSPFEDLVRRALLDVNYKEYEQVLAQADAIVYDPSPRYLAWEKKFLAAPFAFAKKHARPVWQRFLRTAACVLLAVSVAFGGLMAASPTARAWVQQIIAQWFGEYARFSFSGNAGQETGEWKTTWLPEGFELVEETQIGFRTETIYHDGLGDILQFTYAPVSGATFSTNSENHTREDIFINDISAYLLRTDLPGKSSFLIWTDSDNGVAFRLAFSGSTDVLVRIAESIQKVK